MSTETGPRDEAARARDPAFRAGDPVLLLDHRQRANLDVLRPGGRLETRGRRFEHDALIGSPVGESICANTGERYLALRPTLADYVLNMPRAATPLYPKDVGALLIGADLFPGAAVLEAGTGSGGLTLALLRAVGASGRVVSYEARSLTLDRARENVRGWCGGDPPNLTLKIRDVVAGIDEADGPFDRIALDLPEPARVVPHLAGALRPGGVFAAFTPGVLQMQQLVQALVAAGFVDLECQETTQRRWNVTPDRVRPEHRTANTGFLTFARPARGRPDVRAEPGANPDG